MNPEVFWRKVQRGKPAQCWPWLGYRVKSGHGMTTYKGTSILASRKAWILAHGPISSELCVNHKCDNAACCNVEHLYLGSRRDNMIDRWAKLPPTERLASGRRHAMSDNQIEAMLLMHRNGATMKECAERFGVHAVTIRRIITTRRRAKVEQLARVRLSKGTK